MPREHLTGADATPRDRGGDAPHVVALAGQPNVGKTTVFNLLTRGSHHVGNWPGKTVQRKEGTCLAGGLPMCVVDLPGTYSLSASSDEERIARDFILRERPTVVVLADATGMERSLYLLAEISLLDVPVVLGLNMMDAADEQGIRIEPHVLEAALGIPVVPLVAVRGQGLSELLSAIARVLTDPARFHPRPPTIPDEVSSALRRLLEGHVPDPYDPGWVALKLIEGDEELLGAARGWLPSGDSGTLDRLLRAKEDAFLTVAGARYEWIERMVHAAVVRPRLGPITVTDRLDRLAIHPLWGRALLALVLGVVFAATFGLGAPVQRWLDGSALAALADALKGALSWAPRWFADLMVEGVIGGAGRVFTLVPVLVVFFAGMAVLEDSGYLARAAFLLDGLMHRIGLHGKSFFPLFVGFGCNVPAVLASRIVESERARRLTILLIPLVPCTGRLAVVAFVSAVLFERTALLVAWGLVVVNLLVLAAVGAVLSRWVLRGEREPFIMVLPLYQRPRLRAVARATGANTWAFVRRAGTLIVAASVVVWMLSSYPGPGPDHSALAAVGRALGPLGRAMGMDWRLLAATLSGFVAKENVVATLGILYGAGARTGLATALSTSVSPASGVAFLVVQMLFIPCVSTIAAMRQEMGNWRWPLAGSAALLVIALFGGVVAYQTLRLLGMGP